MTVARSTVYRFFAVDCDTNIAADTVEISLDQTTWATASHTNPSASVMAAADMASPVPAGLTRYWWRVLTGPTQTLQPVYGYQTVHGRITDSPEIPYLAWTLTVPND